MKGRYPSRDTGLSCGAASCAGCASGSHNLEVELDRDLRVEADGHLVRAHGLDRRDQRDTALVDDRAARVLDRRGDVGRGDRAEESPGVTGAGLQLDPDGFELGLDLIGLLQRGDRADPTRTADLLDVLLAALRPAHGEAARDQVVAGVAVLDLDDVAGGAEAVDLIGEEDLHGSVTLSQPAVEAVG